MKTMMKYAMCIAVAWMAGGLIVAYAQDPLPAIDAGYDADGAYVEELVNVPHGLDIADYVSAYSTEPPKQIAATPEIRPGFVLTQRDGMTVAGWQIPLGVDRTPEANPHDIRRMTAQNGGEALIPPTEEPEQGRIARTWEWVQENPGKSALIAVGAILAIDYAQDGSLSFFGLRDGGGGNQPNIQITDNRGTVVVAGGNITQDSGNSQRTDTRTTTDTRTDSTSPPAFPPQ